MKFIAAAALAVALALGAARPAAADCAVDHKTRVAGGDECLVIGVFGEPAAKTSLAVFIHGDGSRGGPSDYLFALAESFAGPGVVTVGLIRPGYFDSDDNTSTGESYRHEGDGYRPEIVEAVAGAVKALKAHYGADYVVLVGHSGGAAISGVIAGRYPDLAQGFVLGGCPCHVPDWRFHRRGQNNWGFSQSPHDFADAVPVTARVRALTGGRDRNTISSLAEDYVQSLKARGIAARFDEVSDASHNGVARSEPFKDAIREVLAARP